MENNAIQNLSLMEMGVTDFTEMVEKFSNNLLEQVKEGLINPIEVKCKLNKLQKACENVEKSIIDEVNNEIDRYGNEKTIKYAGFTITRSEQKKYDFSGIGEWCELTAEIDRLSELRKEVETKYKTASKDNVIVDTTTGEEITSVPYSVTTRITVK